MFCEAVAGIGPETECHTAENGIELFDLLSKHKANRPDIIFLDINMPVMNGWECLQQLKNNTQYNSIPIIMYSTSSAKKDIDMAYDLGALLFVTKPEDFRELSSILHVVASNTKESLPSHLKGFRSVKVS